MDRKFIEDNKEYKCTDEDILKQCGKGAEKLVRCRKGRYGFEVIYKLKPGQYDDRDSGLVRSFISFFYLIKKNKN
jgi:hypothetical protein